MSSSHPTPPPYSFDHATGWRQYRMLRPGWGMYHDIKRRLPYYRSDITDALNYRTFAGTVRIYFVKYAPPYANPNPQSLKEQAKQRD